MTSDNEANAFSASVIPGGIQNPGQAPSTIPQKGVQAAGTHSKVIVVFKAETPADEIKNAEDSIIAQGGKITHRYSSALLGFAAELPDNSFQALKVHPKVDYIEADGAVSAYVGSNI
ncbi:hypothetical protein BGX30_000137 [Mortierella sp. GBA39]|nr:hypothetical protein BGX30_000137 [Mortierella sp. GBA39]